MEIEREIQFFLETSECTRKIQADILPEKAYLASSEKNFVQLFPLCILLNSCPLQSGQVPKNC
jgi:hypothetical protein